MNTQLNKDPKDLFGEDLIKVFGPKATRRHISELTYTEKMQLANSVPNHVPTDHLGKSPTLFEITNTILTKMMQSGKFQGIDLNFLQDDGLITHGLKRPKDMYIHASKIGKNNSTQRGIMLRHLILDILFNFNPKKVLCGLARYSKKQDFWYLNDAQHRTVACLIIGIRWIPLEYEESEYESIDVEQYSCVNIYSLEASQFDKYRNYVQMMRISNEEGRDTTKLEPRYHTAWAVHQIVEVENGIRMVQESPSKMECSNTHNMMREYDEYGEDIFRRAVTIVAQAFSNSHISEQNIHMVCEFIKHQEENGVDAGGEIFFDMAITSAINHWCPKGDKTGLYLDAQRAINSLEYLEKEFKTSQFMIKWSAGLLRIIRVTSPEIEWAPIIVGEYDVADKIKDVFRVMPKS